MKEYISIYGFNIALINIKILNIERISLYKKRNYLELIQKAINKD